MLIQANMPDSFWAEAMATAMMTYPLNVDSMNHSIPTNSRFSNLSVLLYGIMLTNKLVVDEAN